MVSVAACVSLGLASVASAANPFRAQPCMISYNVREEPNALAVGDIDGDGLDDVVAVYTDGSFEIFVTIHDHSKDSLAPTYIGFHSMGIKTELVGYTITTVNFIGTLYGYGTSCRGNLGAVDWGCTSSGERAVFVGTEVCKLLEFPDARHVPPVFPVRRTRTTTCGSRLTGTRTLQVCRT